MYTGTGYHTEDQKSGGNENPEKIKIRYREYKTVESTRSGSQQYILVTTQIENFKRLSLL
jgi:hypothetical protein